MLHLSQSAWLRIRLLLPVLIVIFPLPAATEDEADHELGKQVFLEEATPPCAICHELADAEAEGTVAPSLDQLKPTKEQVIQALEEGPGAMPVYSESLSDEQVNAVAEYVAAVAGQ